MSIWQIVEYSLVVTIVAILLLCMKRLFHDKLDARWHYFIWMVLALRMMVPLKIDWLKSPLSLFEAIPVNYWTRLWALKSSRAGLTQALENILPWYLAGAGILAVYYIIIALTVRVKSAMLPEAEASYVELVKEIAQRYDLKPCKHVKVTRKGSTYVCGLFCPILVLSLQEEAVFMKPLDLEQIVVHELLHKKHGDVLINYMLHLVRVLNWFNPLIWYVTKVILNDSEALCDQRVLELMGKNQASEEKNYGNLLISMAESSPMYHAKIGTTNMANSYRSMRIRIKRIADFNRVPSRVGLVALCITILLSVSSIGYCEGKNIISHGVKEEKDLNRVLLRARLYEAETPEQAIYLYLKALKDMNPVYLMAVMPNDEIPSYEEWIKTMFLQDRFIHYTDGTIVEKQWINYNLESKENPDFQNNPYFTQSGDRMRSCTIFGMKCEEEIGSAVLKIVVDDPVEVNDKTIWWEVALLKEDGWKVKRVNETVGEEAYEPKPIIKAYGQRGDWKVCMEGQNEAHFASVFRGDSTWHYYPNGQIPTQETMEYPKKFEMIMKMKELYLTYLGDQPLYDTTVEVFVKAFSQEEYEKMAAEGLDMNQLSAKEYSLYDLVSKEFKEKNAAWRELAGLSGSKIPEEAEEKESLITGGYISSSTGAAYQRYEGSKLVKGEKLWLSGGGSGYDQWEETDSLHFLAWIFYNGECVEVIGQ